VRPMSCELTFAGDRCDIAARIKDVLTEVVASRASDDCEMLWIDCKALPCLAFVLLSF